MFSSPVGTEMFHFPTFPPHALCVQARVTPHDWCGVPPFGHPRINARLAAPRGLSQPPTSFIGSWCPGIHRVPLTTWPHNYNKPHPPPPSDEGSAARACNQRRCSRPLCSSQPTTRHPPNHPAKPRQPRAVRDTADPARQPATPVTGAARSLRTQQRAYDHPGQRTPRSPRHTHVTPY